MIIKLIFNLKKLQFCKYLTKISTIFGCVEVFKARILAFNYNFIVQNLKYVSPEI